MFYKNNIDYAELIWEDFSYQIDNMQLKKGRCENMPYPRFTKIIINHFLSIHKSIPKGPPSSLNTIKDDGVLNRFVLPKKTRAHELHASLVTKKATSKEAFDDSKPTNRPTSRRRPQGVIISCTLRVTKKKSGTGITLRVHDEPTTSSVAKANKSLQQSGGSNKGTGITPGVPDELTAGSVAKAKQDIMIDRGFEDESNKSEENISDEEEENKDDDDDDDDDKNIDIEKTNDEDDDDEYMTHDEMMTYDKEDSDEQIEYNFRNSSSSLQHLTPQQRQFPPHQSHNRPKCYNHSSRLKHQQFWSPQECHILEQEVKELKQVDHSTTILASVRSHVPTVVNEYLGSTLGDTLHKVKQEQAAKEKVMEFSSTPYDLQADEEDEDPSASSNQGKKKKRQEDKSESSKKPSASKGSSKRTNSREIETNVDQPKDDALKTSKTSNKIWFKQPPRPPTPDPEWNNVQTIRDEPEQTWFNDMMHAEKPPLTFDELMATPIDFSNFVMNRLKIDNLSQEVLLCRLGHLTVAAEYFFNNDLEYLNSGSEERRYTTSITKTKAVKYDLKFIEDMIPNQWSLIKINKFSPHDVYLNLRILSMVSVKVKKLHGYGYLKEIIVQRKLFNLKGSDLIYLAAALRMFARQIVIQKRVEDVQLGVKSYQKKLNLTRPQQDYPNINIEEAYTPSFDPPRDIYEDASNQKRLMIRQSATNQRRSGIMVDKIDELLMERHIMRNLERLNQRDLPMDILLDRTEVLRNTKMLFGIEDSHHGPSDAVHNPLATQEYHSDTKVFTVMMEILPEPTSNKLCGRPIRRIQDFDESKDYCLTLKNTSYPYQEYTVYNTLVNEEESTGFTLIRRIHQEDMAVSFDDSDDEDYTVIFDKNSFSYKIIFVNDLKTDSENDNEKVNMPSFPPPEPTVSCFDDLDFFKDFENEFPAIVYNNAQTSKSDLLTELILNPQHIDEFNLKDETSLSECDEEEQNVLNFNDLFPFNVIYPNDSKSDKDNDDDKVDIKHSSRDLSVKPLPDVINTDVGAYAHGSNKLLETRPRERNINEYWWRIYKSRDLEVLES
ncbi:hypothetical protein Tco_1383950 [Tanacetum coccineum]